MKLLCKALIEKGLRTALGTANVVTVTFGDLRFRRFFVIHVLIFNVDREPRELFLFDKNSFVLLETFCLSS